MASDTQSFHMEGNMRTVQQLLPPPHPYPWLLFFNGEGAQDTQNFCTISDAPKTYSRMIPELGEGELCFVQDGWFLFVNHHKNVAKFFLWNPSNLTRINLPPLKHNDICIREGILTSSPTKTDEVCSVFLFSTSQSIIYWCFGDKQWSEVNYHEQLRSILAKEGVEIEEDAEVMISLSDLFYYNGLLYAEADFMAHLLVEIKKLEPCGLKIESSHIFYPTIQPFSGLDYTSKMLESNNDLFRIEISHPHDKVIAVVVHKLDFCGKVWHKVESIQDRVFFISDDGSSCACQAINPEKGNRVYISLKKHNFVYIYNMEDKTIMISQPFLNLPKTRCHSCWFMPSLRISGSSREDLRKTPIRGKECNDQIHPKKIGDTITNDEFALPLDIVEMIAKQINVGLDYLHFRATNRLFHSSAPPIQWRSSSGKSMSRFDNLSLSPLFVYFEKDNVLTFVHPMHGLKYKYNINLTMDLQPYCEICYSKDGWLVMVVKRNSSFFFNPFAKEQVKPLPNGPTTEDLNAQCIAFSHPPTSSECVVVELQRFPFCLNPMVAHATIPDRRKVEWDRSHLKEGFDFSLYNISSVFHKGAFYYLNEEGKLGVLKIVEGEGEVKVDLIGLEKPHAPCTCYYNSFLAECNDNLLAVFEGHFGKWVRVFKLNESTRTWIQVKNLENHMLFVGNTSFSAVANVPEMANKIYFPRFYGENIVFYSLETNNYHTFESNKVVNFHDMREQTNSSWIEPRWQ